MSDVKPKIEGARKYRRPARAAGPTKKEFSIKVLGLEIHTFDIGNAKYAAKYKKTVNSIANYIQREYKGRADIAKAIKELSLPSLQIPGFPKARTRETVFAWGHIPLTAGCSRGQEADCTTQGEQEARVCACYWAVLA